MNKKLYSVIVAFSSLIAASSFAATPCKAYVRLDLGYSMSGGTQAYGTSFRTNPDATATTKPFLPYDTAFAPYMHERGMIGDVAVGYAFNDAMRAEVSFDFKPKMQTKMNRFIVKTEQYGGSAKGLYDFNNNTSVTPFVFAGLGAVNIKPKIYPHLIKDEAFNGTPYLGEIDANGIFVGQESITPTIALTSLTANGIVAGEIVIFEAKADGDNGPNETSAIDTAPTYESLSMPSQTVMTYQAGFGLAFKASDAISIDCTYGLGGKTNYQVLTNTGAAIVDTQYNVHTATNIAASSSSVPATFDKKTVLSIGDATPSERMKQIKFKNQMDQSLTLGIRFTM